ncbi:MAG: glycosyltransferase family 39 protein [Bacteroidetes bacterium]|nr:glycosyltransferase family 39 protein [Bacteroidota bacterium]
MKTRHSETVSLKTFWVLLAGIIVLRFLFPRFATHDVTAFLSWDVFSHYLWLPAFFIHDDLGIHDFYWVEQLLRNYQPIIGYRQAILQSGTSDEVLSSTMGMAVMFAPFFMQGHLAAIILGFPADGLSAPYQVAMAAGGLCWSILGIWLLRKILLSFFTDKIAAIAMVLIIFTTGYFNLAAFHGATPENLLFSLYLLLLIFTIRLIPGPSYGIAAGIGLIAGLIVLSRPFDIIVVVPWLLYLAIRLSGKHAHLTAFMVLFFLFPASLQFIYWKIFAGNFYFNTGTLVPRPLQAFTPYIALGVIPVGYFIQYLSQKKLFLKSVFLVVFCCISGWSVWHAVNEQAALRQYSEAPAIYFYRYNAEAAIPRPERYAARTYQASETEVLNHPEWFQTRRIFSLKPGLVRLNGGCRFSPGINAPLADFSRDTLIGLKARAKVFCEGPVRDNPGHLVVTLLRDRQVVNWQGTPFDAKSLKTGQWNDITLNYMIHNPQKNDILQVYAWYTGSRQVLIGVMSVTLFELKKDESPEKTSGFVFN